jgi:hypothetical protein
MENEVKSGLKPWMANLIVFVLELIEIILYFAIAGEAVGKILKGDISGAFDNIVGAIWFVNISALAIAFLILFVKPLRTPMNKGIAYWNFIWVAMNIYSIYG